MRSSVAFDYEVPSSKIFWLGSVFLISQFLIFTFNCEIFTISFFQITTRTWNVYIYSPIPWISTWKMLTKTPVQEWFFSKVAGYSPATSQEVILFHWCFFLAFCHYKSMGQISHNGTVGRQKAKVLYRKITYDVSKN